MRCNYKKHCCQFLLQCRGSGHLSGSTCNCRIPGLRFLIQDMFPITEKYIEREYTIGSNHLMLTSEHTVNEIERKARKVMSMLKRGVKFTPTQPDVMEILKKLREP